VGGGGTFGGKEPGRTPRLAKKPEQKGKRKRTWEISHSRGERLLNGDHDRQSREKGKKRDGVWGEEPTRTNKGSQRGRAAKGD